MIIDLYSFPSLQPLNINLFPLWIYTKTTCRSVKFYQRYEYAFKHILWNIVNNSFEDKEDTSTGTRVL